MGTDLLCLFLAQHHERKHIRLVTLPAAATPTPDTWRRRTSTTCCGISGHRPPRRTPAYLQPFFAFRGRETLNKVTRDSNCVQRESAEIQILASRTEEAATKLRRAHKMPKMLQRGPGKGTEQLGTVPGEASTCLRRKISAKSTPGCLLRQHSEPCVGETKRPGSGPQQLLNMK